MNREKDLLLRIASFVDKTAFRCEWCGRLARGIAPRVMTGWCCSGTCFESYNRSLRN